MKMKLKDRIARIVQLPTVLLMLALGTSFASVGHAEEIDMTVTTAKKSADCHSAESLRHEMKSKAQLAVWKTRISVATDLGVRLTRQHRSFRVAGKDSRQRG